MKSLLVLQRLAGQAVDRERQALQALDGEITEVERERDSLRRAIEQEAKASLDFMTSGVTLQAFLQAAKLKIRTFEDRLNRLQEARDAQLQRLLDERIEEKRYESLAERRAKRAAQEAAAKEQKAIDELVTMRARRR